MVEASSSSTHYAAELPAAFSSPVRTLPKKAQERKAPLQRSLRTIGALAFVDRDDEAFLVALVNLRNKRASVSEQPVLVTAGQLYGAGKSQMGKHAVARVRETRGQEGGVWSRLLDAQEDDADVMDYAKAVTVSVDLRNYSPSGLLRLDVYLGYALYEAIRALQSSLSGTGKLLISWPALDRSNFTSGIDEVVRRFIQETMGRSIFIHWDEVRTETL